MSHKLAFVGVNQAGAEFGVVPGIYNSDYTYPLTSSIDYFVDKGMNTFRLPFKWERLQRTLNGEFDAAELSRLEAVVDHVTHNKLKGRFLLLDPHNYARYNGQVIGAEGSEVSVDHFTDFWTRLSNHFKDNNKVIFGLMNEPHGMTTELWKDNANAAIAAIRATSAKNLIFVPGNGYTGAHSWSSSFYGTPNAEVMVDIVDPRNNYVIEVHQYFDSDSSGGNATCESATVGVDRLVGFTQWARYCILPLPFFHFRKHKKRAFLGEFGGANNALCNQAVFGALKYMVENSDVWIGWAWWAAGPWWGEYMFSIEPDGELDKPQMEILAPFLN